jgi:flagellin-like protein
MDKRGLSPVIATVLLVSLAVVLAMIIFLWARSVVSERIEKFGEPAENACDDVLFDAEIVSGANGGIYVENRGSVPIYALKVLKKGFGSVEEIQELNEDYGTIGGETTSASLPSGIDSGEDVVLIPIVLGETSNDYKKQYVCGEDYGITRTVL